MDPYTVMGLSPDATDEEIKKKYRTLVRQYHPDLNPDDADAACRMSEINEAYELIRSGSREHIRTDKETAEHGSFYSGGTAFYYEFKAHENADGGFFRYSQDPYKEIERCIMLGNYSRAADILDNLNERNGRWFYYTALVYYESGYFSDALRFAERAHILEPDNRKFKELYERIYYEGCTQKKVNIPKRVISAVTLFLAVLFILYTFAPLFSG